VKLILFVHLICAVAWLGCVLVEAILEHSIDSSPDMRIFISKVHWSIDKFIEIPAFVGVLITGGLMLLQTTVSPLLWTKIAFGLVAIVFNAICVGLVVKRLDFAKKGDFLGWETVDHKQHKFGAVVLIALLIALAIGGYLFSVT
jgi:hypothetical protein